MIEVIIEKRQSKEEREIPTIIINFDILLVTEGNLLEYHTIMDEIYGSFSKFNLYLDGHKIEKCPLSLLYKHAKFMIQNKQKAYEQIENVIIVCKNNTTSNLLKILLTLTKPTYNYEILINEE